MKTKEELANNYASHMEQLMPVNLRRERIDAFLAGFKAAEQSRQAAVSGSLPLPKEPLCRECGGENMQYVEQYASGEWWKCEDCGFEGHHSRGNDR